VEGQVKLTWDTSQDGTVEYCYVGAAQYEVAVMAISNNRKWWEGYTNLPDIRGLNVTPAKKYMPKEHMRKHLETLVREWFKGAKDAKRELGPGRLGPSEASPDGEGDPSVGD
jgi:hypothetical protein